MKEKKEKNVLVLTKRDLGIISQVLFSSRWTGKEWENEIKPLINKIARIMDSIVNK